MNKEEIVKIIDLLSGAGHEVESIAVDKFPKPPSGTFFVRFNKRTYPKKKNPPKSGLKKERAARSSILFGEEWPITSTSF
jgi:hypothetical protein